MSKESDLSFQVPLNSRCWIESPLQQNQNETINNCENSFGIDYFPEKSSPIPKKIIRSYSFSTKSKRFSEMNEDQDSMMYEWKNTYKEIIDVDMNKLLLSTFENKSGFQLYKLALECIERHLNEDKCILGIILKKYTNYILNTYQFMGQVLFDKISNSDLKNVFSKMIADIHCFCQVFQKTLSEFYQLKVLKKKHKEIEEFLNENNLENFVIQLIYQKQDIYDIIYETEKQLAKCFESDFTETKNLLEAIEIKDCFTPFEKTNKMKLLSPNMKTCCEKINEKLIDNFPKGFDNFSYAIDHYKEAFKPFSSYKNLIEGVKYLKNPLEKLMIFSRPRQIIRKFMEDMDYPDFDLIDKRDEIKILFFLIIKSDLMTIFIELNIILATVKAQEKDLRILKILLKCINHLMKLQKKKELVRSLKAEGFLAKMIEKHYLKKMINFSVKK